MNNMTNPNVRSAYVEELEFLRLLVSQSSSSKNVGRMQNMIINRMAVLSRRIDFPNFREEGIDEKEEA